MSEVFLHGAEVIEIDDGLRPIRTVRSSVIGVVGTAPDSLPAVPATADYQGITFSAVNTGSAGNSIRININAGSALAFAVDGNTLNITLGTATTVDDLATGLAADTAASALVTTSNAPSNSTVIPTVRAIALSGGADEPFPLNKPVLVAADRLLAAKLGASGTLPKAMQAIFKQTGAVVVVVRVDEGLDNDATMANVAGGYDSGTGAYTGAWAFLGAESVTGYCPRILCAPGWTSGGGGESSSKNPVVAEFETIAARLRAIAIADGPSTTAATAITERGNYGSKRIYLHDVNYLVAGSAGVEVWPASGFIAGLIARVDNTEGFWVSPSNHEVYGIVGTERPIDFTLGDSSSEANLLNENDVATTIRKDGFRLWGNRTCSADSKWAFLSRVRTADMINDSILRAHMWAVDRNITKTYIADVVASVKGYLARLQNSGAIIDGNCWASKDANPPENIAAGQVIFDFDFCDSPPAERVTFRSRINEGYLEEVL